MVTEVAATGSGGCQNVQFVRGRIRPGSQVVYSGHLVAIGIAGAIGPDRRSGNRIQAIVLTDQGFTSASISRPSSASCTFDIRPVKLLPASARPRSSGLVANGPDTRRGQQLLRSQIRDRIGGDQT